VESVLQNNTHPSADDILQEAQKRCPTVSRATVYNTLNLLVKKRLLEMQTIKEGAIVFDPNIERHHHLVDCDTGEIFDIPWEKLEVKGIEQLKDFEVVELQVVMRGRKKRK